MPDFLWFFHFFHHCCLCIWNFRCLRHRNEFVNKTVMIHTIHPFFSDVILVRFVSFRRHQQHKHTPFCVSQCCVGFLHCSVSFFLQGLPAGIGTSNFLRAAFILSWNFSHFRFDEIYSSQLWALSSFGFSMAHFCFVFFFAGSDMCFHMSGHTSSWGKVLPVFFCHSRN